MACRSQRSIQTAAFCLVLLIPSGPDRSNVTAQVRTSSDTLFSRSRGLRIELPKQADIWDKASQQIYGRLEQVQSLDPQSTSARAT